MEMKEILIKKFPIYRDDAAALACAEAAMEHFQKKGLPGYDSIVDKFLTDGRMEFRGFEVKNAHQAALLMQVFRNVNLETFRLIYMRGDRIAAMTAVESRMPHIAYSMTEKTRREGYYHIQERMRRLGADGYYIVHNHPTGEVTPSFEDMRTTASFSLVVPGFRGHIILDHDRYALLGRNGMAKGEFPIAEKYQNPLYYNVDTYLIGTQIATSSELAGFIDHLNPNPDKSVIVYCDGKGMIRQVEEIPDAAILHDRNFPNYLRNRMIRHGCPFSFLGTENADVYDRSLELVAKKYLRDSAYMDGIGIECAHTGIIPEESIVWTGLTDEEIYKKASGSGRVPIQKEEGGRLFVDMDGTLAEFNNVDTLEVLYEKGYFEKLEPLSNVVSGIKTFIKEHPDTQVFVLSSVLEDSLYAREEKNAWLDRYLLEIDAKHRIFVPCGSPKGEFVPGGVREEDVLLDDYSNNLHEWEGKAIKLMNGINGSKGSWQGERITAEAAPKEIASMLQKNMQHITNRRKIRR